MHGKIKSGGEPMEFYDRLRETRKDMDFTQENIAKILKITRQQYSLYETGRRALPAEYLPALCRALGVSSDYILGLPRGLRWPR